ncbi:MAG: dihydrolipoyl dehydrogenase [Candidatus Latescibacterota bacterium]|nr:MAG: dihydrolipoyl dehydrogenase [Candidatus Latescibacterota bacterium]
MTNDTDSKRLAVIGAGPGGYAAAFHAADLGLDVTLIDPETNPGGVCLYRGCIPSKVLLHVAKVISDAVEAEQWGVSFGKPEIKPERVRRWKDTVVEALTGGLGQLCRQRKVNFVQGRARFEDAHTLVVEKATGGSERLTADNAIVATGSRPAAIPGLAIESHRVLDSSAALELRDIPRSLLVVGGGYIGLELGTVYSALGTRVSVVEIMDSLLPNADADLVRILHKRVESRLDSIMLETTVTGLKEQKNGIRVGLAGKTGEKDVIVERVLISVGRTPNSGDLGLENTNVEVTDRGFVRVDESCRTNEPSIFAIGDVVGEPMLAHKASHEGRTAVEVIVGKNVAFEPLAIPAVVFTDPEIAWCGLSEREAREHHRNVKVARFPWAASGRAKTLGRSDGLTKLIIDPDSERLLGMGIVGPGAGELIAEGVLAIEMGALAADISLSIHPHPTLSETVMEAADVFFGRSTHVYRPRRG